MLESIMLSALSTDRQVRTLPPSISHLLGSTYMKEYTAFFYGTLMHPKILKAVIRNDGSHSSHMPCCYPGTIPGFSPVKVC